MKTSRLVLGIGAVASAVVLTRHAAPIVGSVTPLARRVAPRFSGVGAPGHVALTFDDGPDPASTPAFLEVLDELGVTATFFMLGVMARRAPALAAEVAAAGHDVAVHGDEHVSMLLRSARTAREDVRRSRDDIAAITGSEPVFFRPPYGHCTWGALRAAHACGLETVLWSAWGRDWRANATPASVVRDVCRGVVDGGTVLLHDSDCTSAPLSWRSAVGALPELVGILRARGLEVGSLREHGLGTVA